MSGLGLDATSDVLSAFAFLEEPRCSWMPFSHYTDIETQKVSKNELLDGDMCKLEKENVE